MKKTLPLAFAAILSGSVIAAPTTYVIEGSHTMPRFEYSHFGYSTQLSRFDKTSGTITIDRAAKTGTLDITIDATSINTGYALFNEHIQDKDFFDTANFPTITFQSEDLFFAGDQITAVNGNLTIKGISQPVTLALSSFLCMPHPILKREACGATATATVKRSDFNMGKHAPYVSDEILLTIPVEAIKQEDKNAVAIN